MAQVQTGSTNASNLSRLANFHATTDIHEINAVGDIKQAQTQTPGSPRRQAFVQSAQSHINNANDSVTQGNRMQVSGPGTPMNKPANMDSGNS